MAIRTSKDKNSYTSLGDDYIISYFKDDKKLHFYGKHKGQISSNLLTIESFYDEQEMIDRINELQISVPERILWRKEKTEQLREHMLEIRKEMKLRLIERRKEIIQELKDDDTLTIEQKIDLRDKYLAIEQQILLKIRNRLLARYQEKLQQILKNNKILKPERIIEESDEPTPEEIAKIEVRK